MNQRFSKSQLRSLAILNAVTFATLQMMTITLYPFIAQNLRLDLATVVASFSAGSYLFFVTGPYWAAKSDQIGRERTLAMGSLGLLLSLGILLALITQSSIAPLQKNTATLLLFASRIIYGLIASAVGPSAQALQADLAEEGAHFKAMTTHSLSLNIGRLLGPLLVILSGNVTTWLLAFCLTWTFILLALNGVVASGAQVRKPLVQLLVQPLTKSETRFPFFAGLKTNWAIFSLAFLFTVFIEALNSSLSSVLAPIFNFDAQNLASSGLVAKVLLVSGLIVIATQFLTRLRFKLESRQSLGLGSFALLVGICFYVSSETVAGIWASVFALSIGIGLTPPGYLSLLTDSVQARARRGAYAGSVGSVHALGYATGGALASAFLKMSSLSIKTFLVFIGLSMAIAILALQRRPHAKPEIA